MKTLKLIIIITCFLFQGVEINAQTYCFTAPQGYGAGTTGGGTGAVTTVTTMTELKNALTASGNGIVIVKGSIQCDYLSVLVNNKTLLGLPGAKLYTDIQTAGLSGILNIKPGSSNIIIRNILFVGPGAYDSDGRDCFTNEGTNVWVDHCEFQDGMDGNFDNKGEADNITVTWCKFTYLKVPKCCGSGGTNDHRFTNLVSSSDSDVPLSKAPRKVTWQYCWWAPGCVERMVRARNAQLHQLNCYWNSPNTNKAIGLSAGVAGCSDYVESGVFACSGTVSDLSYGGSPTIAFVNCTGGGSNVGTVAKPSYSYEVTPVGQVVAAVTNSTCGAGATLLVTATGAISASCVPPTTYILTTNASNGTITRSPNATTYNAGTVVTLTATPNAGYQFSGWSGDASGTNAITTVTMSAAKTVTAIFTLISVPTLTISSGSIPQSVLIGNAITSIVYTWGGTATSYTITGLPGGLTATANTTAKTITISGTPTVTGTYTLTTVGGTPAVSVQGAITVLNVPTLTATNATQVVAPSTAISSIVFTWGAAATDVSYTSLPNGLIAVKNTSAKTLTISGTPTVSGTFSVTTIGGSPTVTVNASVTINSNTILANWYPFQEDPISLSFVSFANASLNNTFDASTYTATGNTNGALTLTKGTGELVLTLKTLQSLKMRWCATGGRTLQVVYGATGTENTWDSPTQYASGGFEMDLTSMIPSLVSSNPIIVRIINNRITGGSLYVTDLYVKGSLSSSLTTQNISLKAGWNLISFNVSPSVKTIDSVFKAVIANVTEIKTTDIFWRLGQNKVFNSLTAITDGAAYLVNMKTAGSFSVTGTALTPSVGAIKTGWQLVGCPFQTTTAITTAFTITKIASIKNLEIFWQSNGTGTLQNIEPGNGYFVKGN